MFSVWIIFCAGDAKTTYTYGITSLADKRDFLQQGDVVKFQLATVKSNGKVRAVNIAATRKYIRAKVDSVKGQVNSPVLSWLSARTW